MDRISGLSTLEAQQRIQKYGFNTLPKPDKSFFRLILRQFSGIFNLLLIGAATVTFFLGESIDAIFILFFVFLGTGLNVYQEYKANNAVDKLKSYLIRTITVVRDGQEKEISIEEIVPGDILKLESGDIVPADAVVRHAHNFLVDETSFTGESIPVSKIASQESEGYDNKNQILQGVVVISGNALAEVTATGIQTRFAKIAKTTSTVQADSDLVKGVDRISVFILKATILTLIFIILANLLIDGKNADLPSLLIFAIALAVSVIPEALPLVITFSLSRGALQFAKKGVIVKRLSSVQDLGSVNLLCTDKTGTITENRLTFQNEYILPNSKFHPLVLSRLAARNLERTNPEPFDLATDEALSVEQREIVNKFVILQEEAFDPALRSNGAFVKFSDDAQFHIRRGSPEYFLNQGLVAKELVDSWLLNEEQSGHRVLGVSYDDGNGPKLAGFISFEDRLKSSTMDTILKAKELNVAITIITGDALVVAEAVGREAGLVKRKDEVIEAQSFLSMPLQEQHRRVGAIRVFARTTPEQKLELIELLKEQFTVGFLGEGINDAPALKAANVSMVVQSAADVARETADIVLLKNDLRVIVDGIRLGRETHANTLKYIDYATYFL